MKRVYAVTLLSAIVVLLAVFGINKIVTKDDEGKCLKVGFIYVGDDSNAYTSNFVKAQKSLKTQYKDRVEIVAKYNVSEGTEGDALEDLIISGCDMIFATSYGYGETVKEYAQKYPKIQFCQATCSNANEEPVLDNYHTFMGSIHEGRYISGVVAGMKLKELIENGELTKDQAKIGYVAAYPYAEVISGYTSFFLGVRSEVPSAKMVVKYTDTWSSYAIEKACAKELIEEGCVIISQHSDTAGPAVACEETDKEKKVYHVGYNQGMIDVAPSTYLVGCKINWIPYIMSAVEAVMLEKDIESYVEGTVNGNDVGAGFDEDWVKMLELNKIIAAKGTQERIDQLTEGFHKGKINVFQGDYIGINPYDETDTYDLKKGYVENEKCSAPSFNYVLKDVIEIKE